MLAKPTRISFQTAFVSLLVALFVSSCGIPPAQNRYQQVSAGSEISTGAVAELQQKAVEALQTQNTRLSIDYLERAIKIDPRNPLSWHYLARSYFDQREFEKCLAMIERSMSYGYRSNDFLRASEALRQKCLEG